MKAGVCGQHTRRARGAAVAPASGFGPPRGSVAVASRHTQGKVVAKFPHPSRIKTRIDLATPRKRARELRTSKLGHRSSRRIAVFVAQFPAGAPAQQVRTYSTIDTPRTSTARRSSSPSTGGATRRLSARAASCAAHQLSPRNTSSTKPLALSLAGIPAQIRPSTCSTTPTTPSRRRDRRHRGGRGRASRRCRAATACGAFAWKPPARRRTKGRCTAAPGGAAAGSAGPSRRAAASARPRRRMAGSGIRPASSAAARSAMAPPSPTLAWP